MLLLIDVILFINLFLFDPFFNDLLLILLLIIHFRIQKNSVIYWFILFLYIYFSIY